MRGGPVGGGVVLHQGDRGPGHDDHHVDGNLDVLLMKKMTPLDESLWGDNIV